MPTPQAGESQQDFIDRCIPMVIDDGTAEDGAQAAAVCRSMWQQNMTARTTTKFVTKFVSTEVGEPYRLFPFGTFKRLDGSELEMTPEKARQYKLPGFKPPIKRGGHADDAPALGHIIGLEVVEDNRYPWGPGLYAIPEWNEAGQESIAKGEFRYQSPEFLKEGEVLEDVINGPIEGPLIVGDALLHVPALGGAAAFYSADIGNSDSEGEQGRADMSESTVSVPTSVWDKVWNFFSARAEEEPVTATLEVQEPTDPTPQRDVQEPEEFAALKAKAARAEELEAQLAEAAEERDELRAKIAAQEAETERAKRVAHFAAELADTNVADDEELHAMLAGLDDETAAPIVQRLKALSAQADSSLERDIGEGPVDEHETPAHRLNAAIQAKMKEAEVNYNAAFDMVRRENPDLVREAGR